MQKGFKRFLQLLPNRIFLVFLGVCLLFSIIINQFYQLQILNHSDYANNLRASVEREIEIPATRGNIYDRYGRELAINEPVNVLKFDQQVSLKRGQLNEILLMIANVLEKNGDTFIDNMPITKEPPFVYTGSKTAINQFMYSVPYNDAAHRESLLKLTAEELMDYLRSEDIFAIAEDVSDVDARKIIAMRLEIHPYTYRKYNLVTLATAISEKTMIDIEENHSKYPGIMVDVTATRYYPEGEILGNILGYTRAITESQYAELSALGYDQNDVVGHEGIEKALESELRGEKGLQRVEVDNLGRTVHTIESADATSGNDVYLTIDIDLQKAAYESVEKELSNALIERLLRRRSSVLPLESKEIIVSMLESSQLDFNEMKDADEETTQKNLYTKLMETYESLDTVIKETLTPLDLLIRDLEDGNGVFTEKEILLAFDEQGRVDLPERTKESFKNNPYGTTESVLIDQLRSGALKPNQFAVHPFSASAVVQDVNTGEVLALVGYPSFDSNEMTSNFNAYYTTLFDDRSMLWNRAVMTREAPGSTFKMLVGIAGLEEGVVTSDTPIYCTGVFEKVGEPAPKCWIHNITGGGHGYTDLERALEVSCNYYMYEIAYRLGSLNDEEYWNIDAITKYVEMFGLGESSGIEIAETAPNVSTPENLIRTQLNSVLYGILNNTDERKVTRAESVKKILEKGIYPLGTTEEGIQGEIDLATQYELRRNIEPVLQDEFENELEGILVEILDELQYVLQLDFDYVLATMVEETMNSESGKSLSARTKEAFTNEIEDRIGDIVENSIAEVVEDIYLYDILDSYDYTYNLIYSRQLKTDSESELVKALRERLEKIDDDETFYREHLTNKVKQSVLSAFTSSYLDGLELEWEEGTTVRTAIGQGNNAFTPIQLTKYVAALANGETVYDSRLVKGIYDEKIDDAYEEKETSIYGTFELKEKTMDIVHQGMFEVANGYEGSARNEFRDYEIDIAGKTGTAQKGSYEHSWFVGFAPFDKPQIAFTTTMYYANGLGSYGRNMAKDILTEYFGLNEEPTKVILDNMLVE